MDWSNEPYVRVYTRETDDDLALTWEAIALWNQLMKRFDRSGFVETRRGVRGLAAITRIPLQVVERALPELLEDGRLVAVDAGFVAPNFIAAQEASKSDRQRQKDSRDRRRALALDVTSCDGADTPRDGAVTNSDPSVTTGHAPSQPVTLSSAAPASAGQSFEESPAPRAIAQSTTWQQRKAWWDCLIAAHDRLRKPNGIRAAIRPNAPDLAKHPNENMLLGCERFLRDGGYDAAGIDAKIRHVIAIAELEAERLGHLDYFKPAIIFDVSDPDRFPRKVDTSPEEARQARAPARANPTPSRAKGTIGSASPRHDHGEDSKPAREVM